MKLRYRIANSVLALLLIATAILAVTISHNSACPTVPMGGVSADTMRAIVYRCYGSSDVLRLEQVARPVPGPHQVLVKVYSAAVNPLDWHFMRGEPYLMRMMSGFGAPADIGLGVDFSGTIEAVGSEVTQFSPGDEVFGGADGAFAEYVLVGERGAVTLKPSSVSFADAAATPIAAITALQVLRDVVKTGPGQKVLINGASGGVGTYAVQIAKSFGAEVTGVSSGRNLDLVRSLGADHVFNYKTEDYTDSGQKYDLIIDMVSNHSLSANRSVLTEKGTYLMIGGGKGKWLGPMVGPLKAFVMSPFIEQKMLFMMAHLRQEDLTVIADLMVAGQVRSVIDRHYALADVPAAIDYSEEGHAIGKIIIDVE